VLRGAFGATTGLAFCIAVAPAIQFGIIGPFFHIEDDEGWSSDAWPTTLALSALWSSSHSCSPSANRASPRAGSTAHGRRPAGCQAVHVAWRPMSDDHARADSMRPAILGIALDVAPSLVAYYGLRALGTSEYVALLTATIVAGVKVCYDAVKARRLDPFAGFLMLNFGLSLAVGLATSDARLLLAGNTLVSGIGGLLFLLSCIVGRPLTQVVSERMEPDTEESEPGADAYRRRVHVLLSAMWGIGLLVGMVVHLVVIFTTSVDVANAVTTVISIVWMTGLTAATFAIGKRAKARWERMHGPREQRSSSQG
jgi:hypothetical protein